MARVVISIAVLAALSCARPPSPRGASGGEPGAVTTDTAAKATAVPRHAVVDEGIDLELGKQGTPDPRAAEEAYERACLAGDGAGCWHFEQLQRTRRIKDDKLRAEALAPFEAACAKGDMRGCHRVGMLLDDDGGMALDGARAFEMFERACAGGYAYACVRAATLWIVGPPAQKPEAKATVLARAMTACDAGFPGGCEAAARATEDEAERVRLEARACELGGVSSCTSLARAAIPQPAFACDQCPPEGGPEACMQCSIAKCRRESCCPTCPDRDRSACCADEPGADVEHPLQTTPVDPGRLAQGEAHARVLLGRVRGWLEPSCERGHPRACVVLGSLFADAALPDDDPVRARVLLERACTADDAAGCSAWAESLKDTRGGPRDDAAAERARTRAVELYRKRCDDGDTNACWGPM